MKNKKLILELILTLVNTFVLLFPIKKNKITFVSLEGNELKGDLSIIRNQLEGDLEITEVLYHFNKNDIIHSVGYMFNTIKQIWHINRSKLVLINDNNFVISKFKRPGVTVVQVWHANGAVKKFGNCLERNYEIRNYDYVLANAGYWKIPYSEAFGVEKSQVKITGLPQLDLLQNKDLMELYKADFLKEYPNCYGKKLVLYAPTFRGNIYKGVTKSDIDIQLLADRLGDEYVVLYKMHPLLAEEEIKNCNNIINVTNSELYELFAVSDMLISDYSSIIFDYSILGKPILLYVPDLEIYKETVGCFMEHTELPGVVIETVEELVSNIEKNNITNYENRKFITYSDGGNTDRVMELIYNIIR